MDAVTSYLTKKVLADIDNLSGNTMEKERSQIYYATPAFQNSTKDDLISGKLHLGVFALACSHHSLAQSVGLSFKDLDLLNKYNINSISSINSQQPNYWDKDVKIYTLISDWLSAMVNAHVDVAKDPYINRLNVRTFTLQATAMLLRAGKGESTFYFLAQPVLVEAAKEFEKNSGFYGAEKMSRLKLIKNLQDKYIREMEEAGFDPKDVSLAKNTTFASLSDEDAAKMFDIDYLRKIMPRKNTAEWYINQIKVLKAFEELQPFAQALSELTTISQIDTKKYGNNFALQQAFLMKMADFFKKNASIINPASIIRNTFLKEKLRAALINPRNIFSNSLVRVTRDFEKHRAQLYSLTIGYGSENLTDSVANSITRIMESNYKLKAIAKYARDNGVRAKELLYGDNSIPRRLVKIKRLIQSGVFPELLTSDGRFENALLDNIEPMFKTSPVDFVLPDFLTYKQNKTADGNMDDEVIRAWEELLDFDTDVEENKEAAKEIRKFARDLAIYAMYTSGDAFGKNNIFKFVPNSFRESSGYFDEIRQLEADQTNYYEQLDDNTLLRNLWWNDDIVPQLEAYTTSYDEMGVPERVMRDNIGSGQDINGVEIPGLFTATNIECPILYKNVNGQRVHRLYVKLSFGEKNDPRTTKLYKFVGLKKETVTKNGSSMEFTEPVYKLVTKKGLNFKGKTFIESIGSERTPSVIDINNETFDIDLPSLGIEPVVDYTPASFNNDRIDPINVINQFIFNTEKPSESVSPSASESATETSVQTINKVTEISTSGYTKGLPQENPDIDYVFTENAEAYTYTQNLREGYDFPNPNAPKINVSDVNGTNQAGIRTDRSGNITPNAYGIVVKKYQQNANGKFVAREGQFQDTDEDFAMFTQLNEDMFSKLEASPNTRIVFPSQMALGKAALPLRFAEWLQFELQIKFNIESVVERNTNSNYDGYGLRITDARPTVHSISSETTAKPRNIVPTIETPVQTVYVNHSGGAVGSDYYWGMIGEKYGVKSNHYWYKNITPNGNVEILEEDALEGQQKVTIAARQMGRIAPTHQVRDERLIRNWSQVKYSDAIFAVTTLLQVGDEMNYGKKALIVQGKGGTGYAIQMAINEGKPTYVYDQIRKRWYKNINGEWSETDTPTLTPNFAGIGTRELNEDGKRAIEEVYEKTFKFSQDFVDSETTVQPTLAEQWSQKEGWSVEYFNSRVLPRLNEAWQIEFELSPDQSVNVPRSRTATMNFDYNGRQRPGITATSTIEAIKNGERTATTRYESDGNIDSFWKQFKVGDYVKFEKRNSNREVIDSVIVVVTKPITKLRTIDSVQQSLQFDAIEEAPITPSNRNSYTFGNGFTVELPFALNEQQIAALKELEDFVHNDKTSITLSGYAGTGKTTIISIFHKYLKSLPYMVNGFYNEPLYLAPTHRANAVTRQMNPEANTDTLHSFLGLRPGMDLTSEEFDASTLNFDQTEFKTTEDTILIIDESSMISDELYDFLQESVAKGHDKVIYVGDPAQLKPVKSSNISKVFRDSSAKIELTQVERTGDNAILNEATRLRNGEELTYNTSLNSRGQGIIYSNNSSEVMNYIQQTVNSVEYQTDPLYFKILSGTNDAIPTYNRIVRQALYGDRAREPFVVGELLMAYSNEKRQKTLEGKGKKYLISNSIDYLVTDVKNIKGKVLPGSTIKVDGYSLRVRDLFRGGNTFEAFVLDPNTSQEVIESIINRIDNLWSQFRAFRAAGDRKSAVRLLSEINAFSDSFSTIKPLYSNTGTLKKQKTFDYGYAHTIHKSQGGTYNKVLVLGGTIEAFRGDPMVQQQLKYVAVTRAKEQVMYTVPRSQEINTNVNIATTTGTTVNSELDKLGEQRKNECK